MLKQQHTRAHRNREGVHHSVQLLLSESKPKQVCTAEEKQRPERNIIYVHYIFQLRNNNPPGFNKVATTSYQTYHTITYTPHYTLHSLWSIQSFVISFTVESSLLTYHGPYSNFAPTHCMPVLPHDKLVVYTGLQRVEILSTLPAKPI